LRKKHALEKAASDPSQSSITDYWDISTIDDIEKVINENKCLSMLLQQFTCGEFEETDGIKKPNDEFVKNKFTTILRELFLSAQRNESHYPKHRRHPLLLKKICNCCFYFSRTNGI